MIYILLVYQSGNNKANQMNHKTPLLMIALAIPFTAMATELLNPVPFHEVKMTDDFWRPKVDTLSAATLPHDASCG